MYDYLIVGAGLCGATYAYLLKQKGYKCLVIDKRSHIGGNLYCEEIEGILVHKYGPHIFHTSDKHVWNFVNQFMEFTPFTLQTIANNNGKLYNLPFNMNTFYQLWGTVTPQEAKEKIESQKFKGIPKNLEEKALSLVGEDAYNVLIKDYTEKQWGKKCKDLPSYIINRIPVRFNFDNNYFNDIFQGVANYNSLISGLLEGIEVQLNFNFFNLENWRSVANYLIYTGPIDQYWNYKLGKLEWRSLRFDEQILNVENFQGSAIVNYTDATPYTRIVEHKHFSKNSSDKTIITYEYPSLIGDPYYPINIDNPYSNLSEPNVIFRGRLGEYKYYDMDQIIKRVLYDIENN